MKLHLWRIRPNAISGYGLTVCGLFMLVGTTEWSHATCKSCAQTQIFKANQLGRKEGQND